MRPIKCWLGHRPGRPFAPQSAWPSGRPSVRLAECERCCELLVQPSLAVDTQVAPGLQAVIDGGAHTRAHTIPFGQHVAATLERVASRTRDDIATAAIARADAARAAARRSA